MCFYFFKFTSWLFKKKEPVSKKCKSVSVCVKAVKINLTSQGRVCFCVTNIDVWQLPEAGDREFPDLATKGLPSSLFLSVLKLSDSYCAHHWKSSGHVWTFELSSTWTSFSESSEYSRILRSYILVLTVCLVCVCVNACSIIQPVLRVVNLPTSSQETSHLTDVFLKSKTE